MWANSTELVLRTARSGCSLSPWERAGVRAKETFLESPTGSQKSAGRRVPDETRVDGFRNDDANG